MDGRTVNIFRFFFDESVRLLGVVPHHCRHIVHIKIRFTFSVCVQKKDTPYIPSHIIIDFKYDSRTINFKRNEATDAPFNDTWIDLCQKAHPKEIWLCSCLNRLFYFQKRTLIFKFALRKSDTYFEKQNTK